jgi:hypothetical protein
MTEFDRLVGLFDDLGLIFAPVRSIRLWAKSSDQTLFAGWLARLGETT